MSQFEHVDLTIQGEVGTIQITRSEKKNSMNPTFHHNMNDALTELEKYSAVKALVITGSGDSFCGGNDLKQSFLEPFEQGPDEFSRVADLTIKWFRRLKVFPAVTVASVNGWC